MYVSCKPTRHIHLYMYIHLWAVVDVLLYVSYLLESAMKI